LRARSAGEAAVVSLLPACRQDSHLPSNTVARITGLEFGSPVLSVYPAAEVAPMDS